MAIEITEKEIKMIASHKYNKDNRGWKWLALIMVGISSIFGIEIGLISLFEYLLPGMPFYGHITAMLIILLPTTLWVIMRYGEKWNDRYKLYENEYLEEFYRDGVVAGHIEVPAPTGENA